MRAMRRPQLCTETRTPQRTGIQNRTSKRPISLVWKSPEHMTSNMHPNKNKPGKLLRIVHLLKCRVLKITCISQCLWSRHKNGRKIANRWTPMWGRWGVERQRPGRPEPGVGANPMSSLLGTSGDAQHNKRRQRATEQQLTAIMNSAHLHPKVVAQQSNRAALAQHGPTHG